MTQIRNLLFLLTIFITCVGCGSHELKPVMTQKQYEDAKFEEKGEERKVLSDLEKKYGPNHPQVQQMKMELGMQDEPAK